MHYQNLTTNHQHCGHHNHLMSKCPSRLCSGSCFVVVQKCDQATVSGCHAPTIDTTNVKFSFSAMMNITLMRVISYSIIQILNLRYIVTSVPTWIYGFESELDLDLNFLVQMLPFQPRPVVPSENSLQILLQLPGPIKKN